MKISFASAALAVAVIAAPAEAAVITYALTGDVFGGGYTADCSAGSGCSNSNFTDVGEGATFRLTYRFDTAAAGPQLGNPLGDYPSSLFQGGADYSGPANLFASFEIYGSGLSGIVAQSSGNQGWLLYGSGTTTTYLQSFESAFTPGVDTETGDHVDHYQNVGVQGRVFGLAPFELVDGMWVPGLPSLADGDFQISMSDYIYRTTAGGAWLNYAGNFASFSGTVTGAEVSGLDGPVDPVPEPGLIGLLGFGVLGLAAARSRRRPA